MSYGKKVMCRVKKQDKSSDIEQQPPFGDRKISNIQPQKLKLKRELKFFKCRSKFMVKVSSSTFIVSSERSRHVMNTSAQYERLCLMVRKLCAELKFSKCRSKVMVKVTCSKCMVPSERFLSRSAIVV